MKFPEWLPVYGDMAFRGKCPPEHVEQASFFAKLRREFPDSWGKIALHPRNEGLLIQGQFQSVVKHQLEGMAKGAADIVVPGNPTFICEMKRRDHTQCAWQAEQLPYLQAAQNAGSFVCAALGAQAAWDAFNEWLAV